MEVSENIASNKDPVNTIAVQLLTIWCLKLYLPMEWKNLSKFTNQLNRISVLAI